MDNSRHAFTGKADTGKTTCVQAILDKVISGETLCSFVGLQGTGREVCVNNFTSLSDNHLTGVDHDNKTSVIVSFNDKESHGCVTAKDQDNNEAGSKPTYEEEQEMADARENTRCSIGYARSCGVISAEEEQQFLEELDRLPWDETLLFELAHLEAQLSRPRDEDRW